MSKLLKLLVPSALIVGAVVAVRRALQQQEVIDLTGAEVESAPEPETLSEAELGGEISPELLKILVCPLDKGPLKLSDDRKWLINPRNGYRYPIRNGIPVMLIDEGRKYLDESLIETPPPAAA